MNLRTFLISALSICGLSAMAALPQGYFAKSSKLASGKWVKIGVDQSGVYEISYETLRAMGFSNPEQVGLYGRGGAQIGTNFVSAAGVPIYPDDLERVGVYHYNNKLYFYGVGTQEISLKVYTSKYPAGGYFSRKSKNIYSDIGYYYLSDIGGPLAMETCDTDGINTLSEEKTGLGLCAHEVDLIQNNSNTGQLFFGEKVGGQNPRLKWDLYLPGAVDNAVGSMECVLYIDRNDYDGQAFSYGLEGTTDYTNSVIKTAASTNFRAQEPTINPLTIPGKESTAFVALDIDEGSELSHIDYWTISYLRNIPDLKGKNGLPLAQDFIGFPKLGRGKMARVTIPGGATFKAFDVTIPNQPKLLGINISGADGITKVTYNTAAPQIVVFNPMQPQMQIKGFQTGYTEIRNQNLHEQLAQGADLIIICIPQLRDAAERLANLHRTKDNIRVVVASTDECYNEFSQGVPDPMAYRGMVKAAYSSSYGCRNLLLMGPLYADFRGIVNEKSPEEGLIAYQSTPMNQERGAQNANDFYGMMDDYMADESIEKATVQVGVGILPVHYDSEAQTVIDKVEKYLNFNDFAYYVNAITNIGGVGDNHTHDRQAIEIGSFINRMDNSSSIMTPIVIDAYGYKQAQNKFFSTLNDGRLLVNYFGHGGAMCLNKSGDFFYASDVYHLRNSFHPFVSFAGCNISNCDRGVRGLGESLITSTPYGMIGTILATRETWSGQNAEFFRQFYINLFRNGNTTTSPAHEHPLTLGEVFARTKTQSTYNNELAYQLICDPAIKIPVVTRPVVIDNETTIGVAGEYTEISGFIPAYGDESTPDASYNGTVVIRIMEPYTIMRSADFCSANDESTKNDLDIIYADSQISMTAADVVNGRFSAKIFTPLAAKNFNDKTGRMHITAYSPELKISAGKMFPYKYSVSSTESSAEKDKTAPSIDIFSYDLDSHSLTIKVSDNLALAFDSDPLKPPFKLLIDGKEYAAASGIYPIIDGNAPAYTKTIPLADIRQGTHTAKVNVADAAGNTAIAEIIFDYLPAQAKFAIQLENGIVDGTGKFSAINSIPQSADIVILDSNGMIVRREAFPTNGFEWDARDQDGNQVAKGLYKAYIIETGSSTSKGHSATIDVPVI